MNIEDIKELINNIVDSEYSHVMNYLTNDVDKTELDGYAEAEQEEKALYDELSKLLPKDKMNLLDDYYSAVMEVITIEGKYCFGKGIKSGCTNLNFLKKFIATRGFL